MEPHGQAPNPGPTPPAAARCPESHEERGQLEPGTSRFLPSPRGTRYPANGTRSQFPPPPPPGSGAPTAIAPCSSQPWSTRPDPTVMGPVSTPSPRSHVRAELLLGRPRRPQRGRVAVSGRAPAAAAAALQGRGCLGREWPRKPGRKCGFCSRRREPPRQRRKPSDAVGEFRGSGAEREGQELRGAGLSPSAPPPADQPRSLNAPGPHVGPRPPCPSARPPCLHRGAVTHSHPWPRGPDLPCLPHAPLAASCPSRPHPQPPSGGAVPPRWAPRLQGSGLGAHEQRRRPGRRRVCPAASVAERGP